MIALVLAIELLAIVAADGKVVAVNPHEIVAIRAPRKTDSFVAGANCLIFLTDGRFISARDACEDIVHRLGGDLGDYKLQSEQSRPYRLKPR